MDSPKMKSSGRKKRTVTVEEFMAENNRDPEFLARVAEREKKRQDRIREIKMVSAPVVQDLRDAGYEVDSIEGLIDLYQRYRAPYNDAVPLLISWLPRVTNTDVKEIITRVLCVPWAKEAAPTLIQEFRSASETSAGKTFLKWDIGNTLSVVADDNVFDDIVDLVLDKRHGRDREMLALALANMQDERAVDVLIQLLDDDDLVGHSIAALRKLKAKKAEPYVEKHLSHPRTWVRNEAKKALKVFRRS
jgi:PBS lyase HEAT-like repeat